MTVSLNDIRKAVESRSHLVRDSLSFRADCCQIGVFHSVTKPNYLGPLGAIWNAVRPRRYAAIGVLLGTMEAHCIATAGYSPERIVLIDVDDPDYNPRRNNLAAAYENVSRHFNGELVIVRGDSDSGALQQLGPYDLAYVDGLHTEDAVLADLHAVYPLVQPGGIILVHDIDLQGSGVDRGYYSFVASNGAEHMEFHDPTVAYGLGVIRKPEK